MVNRFHRHNRHHCRETLKLPELEPNHHYIAAFLSSREPLPRRFAGQKVILVYFPVAYAHGIESCCRLLFIRLSELFAAPNTLSLIMLLFFIFIILFFFSLYFSFCHQIFLLLKMSAIFLFFRCFLLFIFNLPEVHHDFRPTTSRFH